METVGLDPMSKKAVRKYSMGMRQRLGIAQAIMEDPDVILLDEPMNGLDNQGVEDIRKVLLFLRDRGKTILLASHSKEDIAVLCDTVTEMESGHAKRVNAREKNDCNAWRVTMDAQNLLNVLREIDKEFIVDLLSWIVQTK